MPVIVLAKMKAGQVEDWRRLDEVWALVGDKPAFAKYVRERSSDSSPAINSQHSAEPQAAGRRFPFRVMILPKAIPRRSPLPFLFQSRSFCSLTIVKETSAMKRVLTCVFAFGIVALLASMLPQAVVAADAPADRVVVMYFHRTQRCPTCLKMGSYSEEAVKSGFAKQIKDGKVEFHYIDFQDEKNAALHEGLQGRRSDVDRCPGRRQ